MTTKEILFGTKLNPVYLPELAKITGIPRSTLYRYKDDPAMIPWRYFRLICKVRGVTAEQMQKMLSER